MSGGGQGGKAEECPGGGQGGKGEEYPGRYSLYSDDRDDRHIL